MGNGGVRKLDFDVMVADAGGGYYIIRARRKVLFCEWEDVNC